MHTQQELASQARALINDLIAQLPANDAERARLEAAREATTRIASRPNQ